MRTIALPLLSTLLGLFQSRALLHLEILSLRQQLAMVNQAPRKQLRFRWSQRLFWVWLYRLWPGCLQTLQVFKPDTLVRWHRKGFRLYWTWKSRCRRGGRPPISPEVRKLIRTMSRDNIGWCAPRIHGELQQLGIHVSQATVAKYMVHHPKPPSQTWRTFLDNHIKGLVSVDFFTVPTATFRILYEFLVLRHDRREVVHFNVTEQPTAQWTAQQMVEAFPWDPAPRYLLRDRDKTYGASFHHRVHSLGMKEVLTAHAHPGKIPTLNGSSDQYVASASIMSSSPTNFISSDFFAPAFLTITRRERILRWANNAQNQDRSSSLTWERSSPSRTSAVCIMSTAAPPETRSQRP